MILIFIFVIFHVPTVELNTDCPDEQVLHVEPSTKLAFCCYSVKLPRGQEYVRCPINGTRDSTKLCTEGLFQEDETTTASEATCTSELKCINNENRRIPKCDENGKNCKYTCVCNYQEGFCGTAYYDCRPFPNDCPKEYVQEDCSCNKSISYGSDAVTTKTPGSDVSIQKSSTVTIIPTTGQPKINTINDTVPTVFENISTAGPGLKHEKSGFPVLTVVGIVIGIIAIAILWLCIIKKCRRCEQSKDYMAVSPDVVVDIPMQPVVPPPGKPTAEVKPLVQGLPQEDSGIQSINMFVESGDAGDSQNVLAQLIPDLPNGSNEALAVPSEEPQSSVSDQVIIGLSIENWATLSPIPSNSFDSDNTSPKQIADCDNTAVKQVEDVTDQTGRVEVEENQLQDIAVDLGASGYPRFQSGSSGWSSFSDNISNSTSGQVDHPHGDFHVQEQEVRIEVNEDDSQPL